MSFSAAIAILKSQIWPGSFNKLATYNVLDVCFRRWLDRTKAVAGSIVIGPPLLQLAIEIPLVRQDDLSAGRKAGAEEGSNVVGGMLCCKYSL